MSCKTKAVEEEIKTKFNYLVEVFYSKKEKKYCTEHMVTVKKPYDNKQLITLVHRVGPKYTRKTARCIKTMKYCDMIQAYELMDKYLELKRGV